MAWNYTDLYQQASTIEPSLHNTLATNMSPQVNENNGKNEGQYQCFLFVLCFIFVSKIKKKPFFSLLLSMILIFMFLNTCPRKNLSDDNIHLCVKREFFTIESIDICNSITNIYLRNSLKLFYNF